MLVITDRAAPIDSRESHTPIYLQPDRNVARISHEVSTATRDKTMSTSLRLLIVLNVLFKYASAR